MNKNLLLGCALLTAISAYPQASKQIKPTGFHNRTRVETIRDEKAGSTVVRSGPIRKPVVNNLNAKATAAPGASCTVFSSSFNAYGLYQDGHEALQYNEDLNAVTFTHRAGSGWFTSPNGNSGTIVSKISTNAGTSWDSSSVFATGTSVARYPQGGLYNPPGNTVLTNAYYVVMGETVNSAGFDGAYFGSKPVTIPGGVTAGTDQDIFPNTAPFGGLAGKVDFPRYGFSYTKDGYVRALGEITANTNGTTTASQGSRGDAILKGTFSAGQFNWSYDSLIPPTVLSTPGTGSYRQLSTSQNLMAWNDAGTIGYVVLWGCRAGEMIDATHVNAKGGYQPMIYKTTNSGSSWSLLPAQDWTVFKGVSDRVWGTTSDSVVPFFNFGEGFDAAVDVNGKLHIVATVVGSYSSHIDSLEYTAQFALGGENYSFPYASGVYPTIYDFYGDGTTPWNYHIVDSMQTEGPPTGIAGNNWVDVPGSARIQISFSPDRTKMFYSWTESDAVALGHNWNQFPNIMTRGFDVTIDKVTPRVDVTGLLTTPNIAQGFAYMHYMGNRSILTNTVTGQYEIPFTISYNSSFDGNNPVSHYYIKGASFVQADFTINPFRPTGVASIAQDQADYEVSNYPNPASESTTLVVNLKDAKTFDVTIYNTVGQLIQTMKVDGQKGNNEVNMNLSNLSKGVYFYSVKANGSVVTKKMIVE